MRKAQVAGRYKCVVEKFDAPVNTSVPLLIIEAGNDPLVEETLREGLKSAYPQAKVVTVDNGHFPYISTPEFYTQQLVDSSERSITTKTGRANARPVLFFFTRQTFPSSHTESHNPPSFP